MSDLRSLYPSLAPHRSFRLKVSDLHELYVEESGNPNGAPAIVLHGGPGGGCNPNMRRFFDPKAYRIILFDQRGCGRSTPNGSLVDNTTWDLVADIEAIRAHLEIDQWLVFGGSWGATLALAYAQTHPERTRALALRGVFLMREQELDWLYRGGASWVWPEAWEAFIAPIPEEERGDLIAAYHRRVTQGPRDDQMAFASRWAQWEGAAVSLLPNSGRVAAMGAPWYAWPFARIETHYFVNGGFMDEGALLAQAPKIAHIPGVIAQGRYDTVTPPRSAWELAQVWPAGRLEIAPQAGHAVSEPELVDLLVRATDEFRL